MDQIKIGKFIAFQRKSRHLTQLQLADRLGVTDRAVSKWERGKSLPDASIMLELCSLLNVTVNDLLSGEVVIMEQYKEKYEKNLLEMAEQKVAADKKLLRLEIVIGFLSVFILLALSGLAAYLPMENWLRVILTVCGFVPCLVGLGFCTHIEQVAGYYQCARCRHTYVPTYRATLFAMHVNRTRYLKCPRCGKISWNKKVLEKN